MRVKLFGKRHRKVERLRLQLREIVSDMAYWYAVNDYENYLICAKRASIVNQRILALRGRAA